MAAYTFSDKVLLFREEGGTPTALGGFSTPNNAPEIEFTPSGDAILTHAPQDATTRVVSVPDGHELKRVPFRAGLGAVGTPGARGAPRVELLQEVLESVQRQRPLVTLHGATLRLRPVGGTAASAEQEIGPLSDPEAAWLRVAFAPGRDRLAVGEPSGRLTLWPIGAGRRRPPRVLETPRPDYSFPLAFDAAGARLAWGSMAEGTVSIWDLEGPPDAAPRSLRYSGLGLGARQARFHSGGDWLATANHESLTFWAVSQPWARVLRGHSGVVTRLAFTADVGWLLSCAVYDSVHRWPLTPARGTGRVIPAFASSTCAHLEVSPSRSEILRSHIDAEIHDLEGPDGRVLFRSTGEEYVSAAFDRSGTRVALASCWSLPGTRKRLRLAGTHRSSSE